MKICSPALIPAVILAWSSAHAATLYDLNDTVLSGGTGANTFFVSNSTTGTGLSYNEAAPSLTWTTASSYTYMVGYFDSTTLMNVNDSITLSYTITPSSGTAFPSGTDSNFRLGLYNSGTNTKISTNLSGTGSTTFNSYTGYQAYYRANGTPTTSDTLQQRAGGTNNILTSNGTTIAGSPTLATPGTGVITGSFTLTLTAVGQLTVTSVLNGASAQTVTDISGIDTKFDTFGIFAYGTGSNPTLTFSNLTVSTVPEPSVVLLGIGGVMLLALRKRGGPRGA